MLTVVENILRRGTALALVMLLAGCSAAPRRVALAPLMIELPQAIIDACAAAPDVKENELIIHFWAAFDDILWMKAGPEVRAVVFGPAWQLHPLWASFASGKPGAEQSWLDSARQATTRSNITRLSDYQLALMRCYFPGTGSERLDVPRIISAFEELGLSTHSKGEDYVKHVRRMASLHAWMQWAAFADATVETGLILPRQDAAAWRLLRRLVLRALLLDAHHDPVQSERRTGLMPPGLSRTGLDDIRRFSTDLSEDRVRRALLELQAIMSRNPQFYPANLPPPAK